MPVIGYSQVKRKAEDAFGSVIEARRGTYLSGVSVVKGLSGEELPTGGYIQVLCEKADPEVFGGGQVTGNWYCDMVIGMVGHYITARDTRSNQESELFDILMRDDLINLLNQSSVSNFYAIGASAGTTANDWVPGAVETRQILGSDFGEFMTGRLYCRPSRTI